MSGAFNSYEWNGAVWNGSSGGAEVVEVPPFSVCFDATAVWEQSFTASAAWEQAFASEAVWKLEFEAEVPEC